LIWIFFPPLSIDFLLISIFYLLACVKIHFPYMVTKFLSTSLVIKILNLNYSRYWPNMQHDIYWVISLIVKRWFWSHDYYTSWFSPMLASSLILCAKPKGFKFK
jgi:hypothetical protein